MISAQRDQDAAFFEDWSEWTSLDDLPAPPFGVGGRPVIHGHRAPRVTTGYYVRLRLQPGWIGCPHFEVAVPNREPAMSICRRLPDARQHPALYGRQHHAHRHLVGTWYVSAQHWRVVKAALPDLKRSISQWTANL